MFEEVHFVFASILVVPKTVRSELKNPFLKPKIKVDDIRSTFLKEKKSFWMTHNLDADNGHIVRKQGW